MGAFGVGVFIYNPFLNAFGKQLGSLALKADNWIASTCQGCTNWCSVEVLVQDDGTLKRAVRQTFPLGLILPYGKD